MVRLFSGLNKKIQQGQKGRNKSLNVLKQTLLQSDKVIWLHCASLGEYEQGLPVFEALKQEYKGYKFVMTFFSPSGYEIRKDNPKARKSFRARHKCDTATSKLTARYWSCKKW